MGGDLGISLMFTDIEGSTRLWEHAPAAMSRALARHDCLVRAVIERHDGRVFKTVGDAFCAAFADASDAVQAAVEIQRSLVGEVWPSEAEIRVRIGVHTGMCEVRGGDYFGPAVNRVARLEAIAHGGQIVISAMTAGLVRERLQEGVQFRDMGWHRLKDLQRGEQVFQVCAAGLADEFPPLRSLGNPALRHNLPELVSSLVGRDAELSELRELIGGSRVVTLVGAGGVGKTRLALQIGAELLDGSGEGVWFADLSSIHDESQVAQVVASALGLQTDPRASALEVLTEALAERELLLILDNCEQVIEGAAALVSSLIKACPGVFALATSREPLRIAGERVYRVPSLALPAVDASADDVAASAAVRLFLERGSAHDARLVLSDENAVAIGSICRRLDGIPLAIELAAARLTSIGVDELARRLGRQFRVLSRGRRDSLARQQTLDALIGWSYDLLNAEEQHLLEVLSVFAGSFGVAAVESVVAGTGSDDTEVLELISALVDKSLLQSAGDASGTRFRLLETIRAFAASRLGQRGAEASSVVRAAHRDHFLSLLQALAAGDRLGATGAFEKVDLEYANVVSALEYSLQDSDPNPGLQLIGLLDWYWVGRGKLVDGIAHARAHLNRPQAAGATAIRARALLTLGHLRAIGEPGGAHETLEEGLAIARALEDVTLAGRLKLYLGIASYSQGGLDAAEDHLNEAIALAREAGDGSLIRYAIGQLLMVDAFDEAAAVRALADARSAGEYWTAHMIGANLGYRALSRGDTELARRFVLDTLAACEELNWPRDIAIQELNLAVINNLDGDRAGSQALSVSALRRADLAGDVVLTAYGLLGCAATRPGDPEAAARLHGAADRVFERTGAAPDPAEARLRFDSQAELRAELGHERFDRLYHQGSALSIPDAIRLAASAVSVPEAPTSR